MDWVFSGRIRLIFISFLLFFILSDLWLEDSSITICIFFCKICTWNTFNCRFKKSSYFFLHMFPPPKKKHKRFKDLFLIAVFQFNFQLDMFSNASVVVISNLNPIHYSFINVVYYCGCRCCCCFLFCSLCNGIVENRIYKLICSKLICI